MTVATISQDNLSSVGTLIMEAFPHEVEKLRFAAPMKYDGAYVPHHGVWYADQCLNIAVKDGYTPHTRDDISALCEASLLGLDVDQYRVKARWTGKGHSVLISPTSDYQRTIRENDSVGMFARIDGTIGRPFSFEVGLFRKVCKNGMFGFSSESSVRIRHTQALRLRMDELIKSVQHVRGEYETIVARMRGYAETRVKIADFISQLYPAPENNSGKAKTQHENIVGKILSRLHREALATGQSIEGGIDATSDLWLLVNSITGYVQHDKTRHGSVDDDQRLDLAIVDSEISSAWELASAMAS